MHKLATKIAPLGALLLGSLLALPAGAGTAWSWQTEDGGIAFTDDADRIPADRRGQAQQIETDGLDRYSRFTPAESDRAAEARQARVERLRLLNAPPPAPVAAVPAGVSPAGARSGVYEATLEVNGATVRIPTDAESDEPVVIDHVRAVRQGGSVTQTATVVRQGGRVRMVVFPHRDPEISPSDFVRVEDLMGGR